MGTQRVQEGELKKEERAWEEWRPELISSLNCPGSWWGHDCEWDSYPAQLAAFRKTPQSLSLYCHPWEDDPCSPGVTDDPFSAASSRDSSQARVNRSWMAPSLLVAQRCLRFSFQSHFLLPGLLQFIFSTSFNQFIKMSSDTGQPTTTFAPWVTASHSNRNVLPLRHRLFCRFLLKDVLVEWEGRGNQVYI